MMQATPKTAPTAAPTTVVVLLESDSADAVVVIVVVAVVVAFVSVVFVLFEVADEPGMTPSMKRPSKEVAVPLIIMAELLQQFVLSDASLQHQVLIVQGSTLKAFQPLASVELIRQSRLVSFRRVICLLAGHTIGQASSLAVGSVQPFPYR